MNEDRERWQEPAGGPNPEHDRDVSPPVIAVQSTTRLVRIDEAASRAARADFDELFRANYDRLVRSLTVACGDREQAADAVQEAFVKAHVRWRRIGRFEDPIGWVRRVAINQLRDEHRRMGRKWRALGRMAARTAAVEPPAEPDDVGRLLAELPRQQRIATALYYVDDMSVAEIAAALGIAEGSVKSHLHDARERLRTLLGHEHGSGPGR